MAGKQPRVVAELGRPETPGEAAARKAESSRIYRSSQTFRHLIAALLATVAVAFVIVAIVPRGSVPEAPPIDVAQRASDASAAEGRTLVTPTVPNGWTVNAAGVAGAEGGARAWSVVLAPAGRGFARVTQAFDQDDRWARTLLRGAAPSAQLELGGVMWDEYSISDPASTANISYALGAPAGSDYVLVHGSIDPADARALATSLAPQLLELEQPEGSAP